MQLAAQTEIWHNPQKTSRIRLEGRDGDLVRHRRRKAIIKRLILLPALKIPIWNSWFQNDAARLRLEARIVLQTETDS